MKFKTQPTDAAELGVYSQYDKLTLAQREALAATWPGLSRRHFLTAASAGVLSACGGGDGPTAGVSPAPAPPVPVPPAPTPPLSPDAVVVLLAGNAGGSGNREGNGAIARFASPGGLVTDRAGNIFVADSRNHSIRKITPTGQVSTFAGQSGLEGSADGVGNVARFSSPEGLAIDAADNLYLSDSGNAVMRKVTPAAEVSVYAGKVGVRGATDGAQADARFQAPRAIACDRSGNLYLCDAFIKAFRKITADGIVTTTLIPTVNYLSSIAVDASGTVFVGTYSSVFKVSPAGSISVLAGGVGGFADGTGAAAQFTGVGGLAVDDIGVVWVADFGNHVIRTITPAGVVSTVAGRQPQSGVSSGGSSPGVDRFPGATDGVAEAAQFNYPGSLTIDSSGSIFISDSDNFAIRKITRMPALTVSTVAGAPLRTTNRSLVDAVGADARFSTPSELTIDDDSNLYVLESSNSVRKVTLTGAVTRPAVFDGSSIFSIARDPSGVFFGTTEDCVLKKELSSSTSIVLAGFRATGSGSNRNSWRGSTDGLAANSRFDRPYGLVLDSAGNLFVADSNNHTIRKISPAGTVSTLAGLPGVSGAVDGVRNAARFNTPQHIALDSANNLYVVDSMGTTVRKVSPDGAVSLLAGNAGLSGSVDGTGSVVRFGKLGGIALDKDGNVYAADAPNHTVRKISPAGVVTTVVGVSGVIGGPVAGQREPVPGVLSAPRGVAVLPSPIGKGVSVTLAITTAAAVVLASLP